MTKITDELTFRRGLTLKNRFIMPPMTTKMSFYDGTVTNDEVSYYGSRAGEVGAIITGAANVQDDGKGWDGELSVSDDQFIPGLAKLAANIKKNGTKAILQIFHAGRMTNSGVLHGVQPVSASAVSAQRKDSQVPRAMEENEIKELIENFKKATQRAIDAGFDGVELHGANTYIIQQFFSPNSNRRDDKWGGSLEKRYQFIDELVDGVISVVDKSDVKNFIVGYRFSPEEYETPGIRMSDTMWLVDKLSDKPLDYLHLSENDYNRISVSDDYNDKPILAYIHDQINGRVPLIGVGDVRGKKQADEVLENAELVGVGKQMLLDPHFVGKVLTNQEDLINRKLSKMDQDTYQISNGTWGFLTGMMPDRIVK
ncbi:NADH-dependent flavin oxidoreductase [Companilactobacillus allii]|uniref:NADH-dependent flavin oxidoreductase n=1 Tax=Companilactobacillus allii TaxID=1847728 RepID=A0A1P8Q5U7_9LACO|nr:NADH-dependent flavin oxidoreductase [Companilactobacillus allii]APX73236.1 NADH-dependent flavin oxidoreductase [Companilactobacillus allii]USQ68048.1 NADH-dependent flavin oxidoreductase [Companilactobacillus allii]